MNVRIKKIAAVLLITLLALAPLSCVQAVGEWRARYIIQNDSYNPDTKTYTAEVYLSTIENLPGGTFGMAYDASITSVSFEFSEYFQEFSDYTDMAKMENQSVVSGPFIVKQWIKKDTAPANQELLLGTITINDVESDSNGHPAGWNKQTLRQLEWYTTDVSQFESFTEKSDETNGRCMNEEIWRNFTPEELELPEVKKYGVTGCYQGGDIAAMAEYRDTEWIDIWFEFNTSLDLSEKPKVTGDIESYNRNNETAVRLIRNDSGDIIQPSLITPYDDITAPFDGRVRCSYEFSEMDDGEYTLVVQKDVHLTYRTEIKVEGANVVENIKLYCGDISADEKIKLNDRSTLLRYLNKRIYDNSSETAKRCDLNGDGKITFHDVNILKTYYNKEYGGEA